MSSSTALWWIRRDLRLHDNQALAQALANSQSVLPVFIQDPALMDSEYTAPQRRAFLLASLQALDQNLHQRGSRLVLRSGPPAEVLQRLLEETGASAIIAEEDYSPYARRRDGQIRENLPLALVGGPSVHDPQKVLKADGDPYIVYTPYMRAWKEQPLPAWRDLHPAPEQIPTPTQPESEPFPQIDYKHAEGFLPGEAAARQRQQRFAEAEKPAIFSYDEGRNRMDLEGTSGLSPYLRFGILSAREVVLTAMDAIHRATEESARRSAQTWLNELIWREFYGSILYHFPHVLQRSFREPCQGIRWREDQADFTAWREGRTGFPVVDAAMRALLATGWMHNRARMIVASFLVKNLLINWQWGERWFMQRLLDGDPAANNGGWQWTAGTGTDAAPYFRIFNPVLQSKKHDPHGEYIRRWVPELAEVPERFIHAPWEMPKEAQEGSGCVIGRDYPAPIVDLSASRERALDAYAHARDKFISE